MSEAIVTIQGWVGGEPQTYAAGDGSVTKFRIAHTPRRFHRASGEWQDGQTQWYTVSAWRQLGVHCQRSLHKGDPVIVHGRISQRTYTNREGVEASSLDLEAFTVGHDLGLGISVYSRTVGSTAPRSEPRPAEVDAPQAPDGPPSWSVPDEAEAEPGSPEPVDAGTGDGATDWSAA